MFEERNSTVSRILGYLEAEKERALFTSDAIRARDKEVNFELVAKVGGGLLASSAILMLFKYWTMDDFAEGVKDISEKVSELTGNLFSREEKELTKGPDDLPSVIPQQLLVNQISPYLPAGTAIPQIQTAKASAEVKAALLKSSETTSVDYATLYSFAGAESSFRTSVSAHTGSAQGLFQFTEGTWNYLLKQYPQLKYTLQDRNDPEKSANVAGLYISAIIKTLTGSLGRAPSRGETYIGYFLGPTGAVRFFSALRANPSAIGAEIFPSAAKRNMNVFYERGNIAKPYTLLQILANQEGKINSYSVQQATPVAPTALTIPSSSGEATPVVQAPQNFSPPPSGPVQQSTPTVQLGTDIKTMAQKVPKPDSPLAAQKSQRPTVLVTDGEPKKEKTLFRGSNNRIYSF